jgi:hypothetical protein
VLLLLLLLLCTAAAQFLRKHRPQLMQVSV